MKRFDDVNAMWLDACDAVLVEGRDVGSRDGASREVFGWSGRLTNVDRNLLVSPTRRIDPAYASAELLWYLSGSRESAHMERYAKQYARFANDGLALGAYGWRWRHQIGFVRNSEDLETDKGITVSSQIDAAIKLLQLRPESRQAVVTMWDSGDLTESIRGGVNDTPCTVCLQYLLRDGVLHCSCYMRSNDVWLGLPYDVFCFTMMQRLVAQQLGARPGDYVHNVGSLHVYKRDEQKLWQRGESPRTEQGRASPHGWSDATPWDVDPALKAERKMREKGHMPSPLEAEKLRGSGPLRDLVASCGIRLGVVPAEMRERMVETMSPRMREAWKLKFGGEL